MFEHDLWQAEGLLLIIRVGMLHDIIDKIWIQTLSLKDQIQITLVFLLFLRLGGRGMTYQF